MKRPAITHVHQDYLKAIFMLLSRGQEATNSAIAESLGVAPASATNMVKRLADMELVEYQPYRGVHLTEAGKQVALETVRHHRLIELFLHDILDIPWDQVHAEAERLEHVISEELEEAIARKLGYPDFDPHGDPIPAKEGSRLVLGAANIEEAAAVSLADLQAGQAATLIRVQAQDSERLRYLGSLGLYPGVRVAVVERAPFQGPLMIEVDGTNHALAFGLARQLQVAQM